MNSAIDLIENISNRSYIAIILVVAALILVVVTWAWMFNLQKKLEKFEDILITLGKIERPDECIEKTCENCYWCDRVDDEDAPCDKCASDNSYWRKRNHE